ncbi:alpha/beta hydrolase [Ferruginibacter profundus]
MINLILVSQAYHPTHFYEYGTVKSVKAQTNNFGDQASVVLFGLKQEKLMPEARPDSAFSEIKLKTKDSLTLDVWFIRVPHSKGAIALFHGNGSEKSANVSQSNSFNEMGYSTLLIDFKAHGLSEGNTCTIGYREAEDVKLAYDFLKKNGENNIILYGISMGAATVTKAIADYDLTPQKIILEMPFASLNETAEGKMRMAGLPGEPLGGLLTFWGGVINGFWAFDLRPKEFVKK